MPYSYTKHLLDEEDRNAVLSVLESDNLTQGPKVEEFEKTFCDKFSAPFSLAVNNGTAALHLAVKALGLEQDQVVLVAAMTFAASANCVLYEAGKVEFVDIEPDTHNIDLKKVRAKIENSPKGTFAGLIVVDFAGLPVELGEIYDFCRENDIWVLEDAAHSLGATYRLQSGKEECSVGACKYSDATTFSFHPAKHVACGEGGMVTFRDRKAYERAKSLRSHGIQKFTENQQRPWAQDMQELGFNYRMSDLNAALGLSQLGKLDFSLERRREIASLYFDLLHDEIKLRVLSQVYFDRHAFHLFVVRAKDRDKLFLYLRELDIHCQIHYKPVYRMSYYSRMGYQVSDYPEAEAYFEECISLPMYPSLKDEDVIFIANQVKAFYQTSSQHDQS